MGLTSKKEKYLRKRIWKRGVKKRKLFKRKRSCFLKKIGKNMNIQQ